MPRRDAAIDRPPAGPPAGSCDRPVAAVTSLTAAATATTTVPLPRLPQALLFQPQLRYGVAP